MAKSVFCIARDEAQACRIVDSLKSNGFSDNDVSVLLSDKQGTRDFAHEKNTKAPEGATTGVATGGILGGTIGWLLLGVGQSFASLVTIPVVAATTALLYLDLRLRLEGLDLELDALAAFEG